MQDYIKVHNHYINKSLYKFIIDDLSNNSLNFGVSFWTTLSNILTVLEKKRCKLIKERGAIQYKINKWHIDNKKEKFNKDEYKNFLYEIGYLVPNSKEFKISTKNLDEEISSIAGPQLVVPLLNARYAVNAANARWGSLYDALYGTDVIPNKGNLKISDNYNQIRGTAVIKFAKNHLDKNFPLLNCSYNDINYIEIIDSKLKFFTSTSEMTSLVNEKQFLGYV